MLWDRSLTPTGHQEPQPTVVCFLCNNQIQCLQRCPGSAGSSFGGGGGRGGGGRWESLGGMLGCGTRGWRWLGVIPVANPARSRQRSLCPGGLEAGSAPAPHKGLQWGLSFLLLLKHNFRGLGGPGFMLQGLNGSRERGWRPPWGGSCLQGRRGEEEGTRTLAVRREPHLCQPGCGTGPTSLSPYR